MHSPLRIGNGNAFRIEGLLDGLGKGKFEGPEIPVVAPDAHRQIYRIIGEIRHLYNRRRILVGTVIRNNTLLNDAARLVDVIHIGNAYQKLHSPAGMEAVVADRIAPHGGIWDDHLDIVRSRQLRREEADIRHGAPVTRDLDILADLERPEDQQHDAARDVTERPLKGKANRNAGGAENGNQARRLDAELGKDQQDRKN